MGEIPSFLYLVKELPGPKMTRTAQLNKKKKIILDKYENFCYNLVTLKERDKRQ